MNVTPLLFDISGRRDRRTPSTRDYNAAAYLLARATPSTARTHPLPHGHEDHDPPMPLVEIRTTPQPPAPAEPPTTLDTHLANFHRRVIQDALLEGTACYWERRADTFATVGNDRCDLIALNCRRHATLLRDTGLDAEAEALIDDIAGTWPAVWHLSEDRSWE